MAATGVNYPLVLYSGRVSLEFCCMLSFCSRSVAILCAAAPESVPFMADESVLAVPGLGRLEYTLKYYLTYAKKVQTKAKQLNSK